jgi:hypothetical protein
MGVGVAEGGIHEGCIAIGNAAGGYLLGRGGGRGEGRGRGERGGDSNRHTRPAHERVLVESKKACSQVPQPHRAAARGAMSA